MRRMMLCVVLLLVIAILLMGGSGPQGYAREVRGRVQKATQIVLLGTGTPNADPARSGPSVAIVVNDTPYIVDFRPGVVRRVSAAFQKGVKGLAVKNLSRAFVTHLQRYHSRFHTSPRELA